MIDFLLVECPSNSGKVLLFENITLASLSSFLSSRGVSVNILDAIRFPKDVPQIVGEIEKTPCPLVGFTVRFDTLPKTLETVRLLRSRNKEIHITLGGHEATASYASILSQYPEVDSIVLGEGEYTLLELTRRIREKSEWYTIAGIAYRQGNGGIISTPPRPLIQDLDTLPFPDRSMYKSFIRQSRSANVYASRGCYGDCSFCEINAFYGLSPGPKWRARNAKKVVDEIEMLVRDFKVQRVFFMDDEFFGPGRQRRRRASQIVNEITSRGIKIHYNITCRANNIDADLIRSMKESGLFRVDIGIESFIPRQLKLYRKLTTPEINHRAIRLLNETGIDYFIYLIPFDPYVSVEELLYTLEMIEKVGLEHVEMRLLFNRLDIKQRMPIYTTVLQDGLITGEEELGSSGFSMNYSFKNVHVEWLYEWGRKLVGHYYDVFDPIYKNTIDYLHQSLSPVVFYEDVKTAIKKRMVERYKEILQMLISGDKDSAQGLMQVFHKEFYEQLNTIRAVFDRAIQEKFRKPFAIRIDREVLHFRSEGIAHIKITNLQQDLKISKEEMGLNGSHENGEEIASIIINE